jgi:hypothetical protein
VRSLLSGTHLWSLSLDAAFFDGLSLQGGGQRGNECRWGHKRSVSMDGATSSFEDEFVPLGVLLDYAKKVVPAKNLVELALLCHERAKRGAKGWHGRGRETVAPVAAGVRDGAAAGG